eukprot:Skav213540  [mRNA]  locus=scaffold4151:35893:48531:- [translate_table: standard]
MLFEDVDNMACGVERNSKFLVGHTDTVLTVAMKGNIVVTGSYDCTAKAWDASRGVLLKTILNDCSVTAVGVEHSTIIIGGVNGVASLGKLTGEQAVLDFSTASSTDCVHLLGHGSRISSVLIHGSVAVTGSYDRTCRIWHATGGVKRVLSHPRAVTALSMHRNLQLLVTGSSDSTRLWNAESGELLHLLRLPPREGHCWPMADQVISVAVSGEHVALASSSGIVQAPGVLEREDGPLGSHVGLAMRENLLVAGFKAP